MLDRLGPKKIVVVSSAPQIRYPDCYGIDMARLEEFIAFRAALVIACRMTEPMIPSYNPIGVQKMHKESKLDKVLAPLKFC